MTVEALLKQLKDERMDALTSIPIYRMKAWRALLCGDREVSIAHSKMLEDCRSKFEQLSITIDEIEKRVS